ncbi:imelysin family protein [Thalassotalea hakodatensis]|uniref:imelysin family protein n=1 Tax=Thalassotalea hakodatensis TaxID=3030492 RepID=UPI0025730DDB|nr:imelysin family protein [Thalassotalea hakodatensis]
MFTKFDKSTLSITVASVLLTSACGESTSSKAGEDFGIKPPPITTDFDKAALVVNVVDNVITPTYQAFEEKSVEQAQAVNAYCDVESQYADGFGNLEAVNTAKMTARDSWREAMSIWQQIEVMQLGPLVENSGYLKASIYSWPTVNTCAVDYDITFFKADTVNGQPYDISKRTPTRRGMAALEYLLFNDNLADSCEASAPDNWNNQSESYRKVARCEFATVVADDINNSATTLTTHWLATEGYANQLKQAGSDDSAIESVHAAVNRITDAMFYIDKSTKDGKLAEPLGYALNECGSAVCPESVESIYAHASIEHITQNLIGFEALLSGAQGVNFFDFLEQSNAADVASLLKEHIDLAIAQSQEYQTSMADTLLTDEEKVKQTHANVKNVTDTLKTDFINKLALELPKTAAGDND